MKRIYLDYGATTPLDPNVALAMHQFEKTYWGNPNSVHWEGQQARAEIDFARAKIASFINAKSQELVFASGATEANNLAIQGVIKSARKKINKIPHVVTTQLEHQSVYNVVKNLQSRGEVEATFIKPSQEGLISANKIINAIKPNTVLISVIFVSNEIGSILPIREIGGQLSTINSQLSTKIYFHTDAVAAQKFMNLNAEKLGVDLMTLSGHKVYGPKGIGALYIKSGIKLENLMFGGSQEYEKRPGTQNTAGIIGMAKAFELLGSLEDREKNSEKIKKFRDELINFFKTKKNVELNGPEGEARDPYNVSITIQNVDQDALITALDLAGLAISTGSACVSGSSQPSHVIQALGKIGKQPAATVRLTLGKNTTAQEIKRVKEIFNFKKKTR